jgi:GAF domain
MADDRKRSYWERFRDSWLGGQLVEFIDRAFQYLLWIGLLAAVSFAGTIVAAFINAFTKRWVVVGVSGGIALLSGVTVVLALYRKLRVERRLRTAAERRRLEQERDSLRVELDDTRAELAILEREFERERNGSEEARRIVADMLGELQHEVANRFVDVDQFVFNGVLEPMRVLLLQGRRDVRVCVLVPRDDDANAWRMRWAVGHLHSVRGNFSRRIDETVAGMVFRRGQSFLTGNVHEDPRVPAANSSRSYSSQMVIRLRVGRQPAGALSVVSHDVDAFAETDLTFARVIAGVVEVSMAAERLEQAR